MSAKNGSIKLVAGKTFTGQVLSFEDEFTNATGGIANTRNGSNAETSIGSFASINTLDLRIVGDAATGKVSAYYRVNSDSGSYTKVSYDITIAPEKRSTFFNSASKAGIVAIGKTDVGAVTATFDSFAITGGRLWNASSAPSGHFPVRASARAAPVT